MIFYLIPQTAEAPSRLEPTQDAARAECRDRGLRFKASEMQHDVPTGKIELMAYVNELLERTRAKPAFPPHENELPDSPPAMSQAEVDSRFTPAPAAKAVGGWSGNALHSAAAVDRRLGLPEDLGARVDTICDEIGELTGHHLGNVSSAVADRFRSLANAAKKLADAA